MPDYTYDSGIVVEVFKREIAPDTVYGSLVADPDNPVPVVIYDMVGAVIPAIGVSDVGTYSPFRADIATGSLSFGSGIYLPVKSIEYQDAGSIAVAAQAQTAQAAADAAAAVAAAQAAQAAAEAASGGGGGSGNVSVDGDGWLVVTT